MVASLDSRRKERVDIYFLVLASKSAAKHSQVFREIDAKIDLTDRPRNGRPAASVKIALTTSDRRDTIAKLSGSFSVILVYICILVYSLCRSNVCVK